jgi:excisionase family DNA binding protein
MVAGSNPAWGVPARAAQCRFSPQFCAFQGKRPIVTSAPCRQVQEHAKGWWLHHGYLFWPQSRSERDRAFADALVLCLLTSSASSEEHRGTGCEATQGRRPWIDGRLIRPRSEYLGWRGPGCIGGSYVRGRTNPQLRRRLQRDPARVAGGTEPQMSIVVARQAWFTPRTLALYLQVSERMVRKWVSEGRLRSYKIDGCRRFDPADVDAFVGQFRDAGGVTR